MTYPFLYDPDFSGWRNFRTHRCEECKNIHVVAGEIKHLPTCTRTQIFQVFGPRFAVAITVFAVQHNDILMCGTGGDGIPEMSLSQLRENFPEAAQLAESSLLVQTLVREKTQRVSVVYANTGEGNGLVVGLFTLVGVGKIQRPTETQLFLEGFADWQRGKEEALRRKPMGKVDSYRNWVEEFGKKSS